MEVIERQQDSNLDILWQNVVQYRSCKHFQDVLNACARFKNLAPYNAMLVQMQRPGGAKYVLTQQQWENKYGRVLKPNARPIITLAPFGPVSFVFEIEDTMRQEKDGRFWGPSDDDILDEIAEPFKIKQEVSQRLLDKLINNLALYGIATDFRMVASAGFGAKIEMMEEKNLGIQVMIRRDMNVPWRAGYLLSVNKNAGVSDLFAAICHELGHLFCHHLRMPGDWKEKKWNVRQLDHNWKEFEAESVAWIVCERLGIKNPSENYLAGYITKSDTTEIIHKSVSIERILAAANEVERMLKTVDYRSTLLYKHCEGFKQQCKSMMMNN